MIFTSASVAPRIITPAPYEPAPLPNDVVDETRTSVPKRALAALLLLAMIASGLLLLLPRWTPSVSPASPASSTVNASAPDIADDNAPPDTEEPHSADARRSAQVLLRAALARVQQLEQMKVASWDRGGLHHLNERLNEGEKAYSEQRFRAAQDAYRAALVQAATLEAKLPSVVAALLASGDTALTAGNSAAADNAFAEVLAITPNHQQATLGRARAATLDRVRALVEQAEAYEQMGDADKARVVYKDAARLDPHMQSVQAGLRRLDDAARTQQLNAAVSAGHVALARADIGAARAAFKRATTLDSKSEEALAGLRETDRRAAAADIAAALERATRAVHGEAWGEAARAYGAALALDGELSVAAEGKRDAEQRAQLDGELESLRADTLALTEDAARQRAQTALKKAQVIAAPGARLRGQITALNDALRRAREALSVTLVSDSQCEVNLPGVGALGRFDEQRVTLVPGRHVALLRRAGVAEQRVEFIVAPGDRAARVVLTGTP